MTTVAAQLAPAERVLHRMLIIESCASEVARIGHALRRGGLDVWTHRIDCVDDLLAALRNYNWDLVICEHQIGGVQALGFLELVRRDGGDVPFIVFSQPVGEECVVDLLRAGAQDFVLKDRIERLLPAVRRALLEVEQHRQQLRMFETLRSQEQRFALALRTTGDGMWEWNPQTGMAQFSPQCHAILGYPDHSLTGDIARWRELIHPDDRAAVLDAQAQHLAGLTDSYRCEHRLLTASGTWKWVLDRGVVVERDSADRPLREIGTMTDISEAKFNETALRESHELLQKLTRTVPGMLFQILLHPDGRLNFPFVSEGVRSIYGMTVTDMRRARAVIFGRIHADDYPGFLQSFSESANQLSHWSLSYRMVMPGAGVRWLHGEATPERLENGAILWHGFIRDITEQREAEAELRLLYVCINQVNDAIMVTDTAALRTPGPRIVYVNPAFERQSGYAASEVLGRDPSFLQGSGTDHARLRELHEALRSGKPAHVELLNYRKSGQAFWNEMSIAPVLTETGECTNFVAVQRDITARKQSDSEREQMIEMLETRNAELAAYNHSVAHDLRNPIISIRGLGDLAELALESGDLRRAMDCIRKIGNCAEQADSLIKSLMTLAKLGRQALLIQPTPARRWVQNLLNDMEFLIDNANATVALEIEDTLQIEADVALLRVIMANLIGNALKHRHPDRTPQLRIGMDQTRDPDGVAIRIVDNGLGIAAASHDRIFDLFERVNAHSDGTGVGLALVERAARLQHGRAVLLYSTPGEGSCFEVWLPTAAGATATAH